MTEHFTMDDLFFGGMVAKAETLAVLSILDDVCRQFNIQDPEGLSLHRRFYKQRSLELDSLFRDLEDDNPALAAKLHEMYERARKVLDENQGNNILG